MLCSVDSATAALMDKLIELEFAGQTTISIMHNLESIVNYDKVAVLDKGSLIEFDTPRALLERPSMFLELYEKKTVA